MNTDEDLVLGKGDGATNAEVDTEHCRHLGFDGA